MNSGDPFDDKLRQRISRLEQSIPIREPGESGYPRRSLRLSLATSLAVSALLVLAGVVAGAAVGATVVSNGVQARPGLLAPSGTFYCTQIPRMAPDRAGVALADLGYTITWQVEDRDTGTSKQTDTAPTDGYIVDGVLDGHHLLLVVERGSGAHPSVQTC
jgi:hypothetical protein